MEAEYSFENSRLLLSRAFFFFLVQPLKLSSKTSRTCRGVIGDNLNRAPLRSAGRCAPIIQPGVRADEHSTSWSSFYILYIYSIPVSNIINYTRDVRAGRSLFEDV